ncbi:MAG: 6-bladed beta-propeller [Gemmatimonadales bacterium]|nr:6-bladed beta-propeller [Gemmatimonadales bacterium]MDZ4389678.1 6-bladed beta-propeller [Gemmatimonadales bacterium]
MLVVACEAPSAEADSYRTLSSDEVSRLELVPLDSLVLTVPGGLIKGITDFQRHDGRYYLLDGDDKVVHVFDAGGNHLLSFGGEGSGPGEFRRPVGLGFDRDEVLVFDPGQGSLMHAFGNDGTFRAAEQLPLPRSRPLWSVEVAEEKLYLLTSGNADSAGGGWDLLTVIDSNFASSEEFVGRFGDR